MILESLPFPSSKGCTLLIMKCMKIDLFNPGGTAVAKHRLQCSLHVNLIKGSILLPAS